MTDILSSRSDTTTRAAADQTVIIAPAAATLVPANPAAILAQQAANKPKSNRKWMLWAGGGLVAAQLTLPGPLKPSAMIGGVLADFYTPIMAASTGNAINLAKKQALANRLAELKGELSDALGKCTLVGILGPDAARLCYSAVQMRYQPAIAEAEAALAAQ